MADGEVVVVEPQAVESATAPRLAGVDAARALAIIGMVAVHFGPRPQAETGLSAWLLGLPYGKASVLFALVAGVGVCLLAARKPETVRARLLYRTLWLFPVGLFLQELDHPVAVILQYYAVWFALAAIWARASDRALLWSAGVMLPIGSVSVAWVGIHHERWLSTVSGGDSPGGVLMDIMLTGFYPTVTWLPVVLFGMWLGRRSLSTGRTQALMAGGGLAVAVVAFGGGSLVADAMGIATGRSGWGRLLSIDGHSEMPLAVIGATGLAVFVLAASLLVVAGLPRLTRPVVAMGQGALSIYVGHLLVWHIWTDLFLSSSTADAWTAIGWFTVVSAVSMTLWLLAFERGPVEAAVRAPWKYAFAPLIAMASAPALSEHDQADQGEKADEK